MGDHDDVAIFKEQIVSFRQWMKERGEQNKPLIISEYGILMPPDYGFDHARVRDFMLATFDFFQGVDPDGANVDLGYPEDEYRLVQAWAWYSLDDDIYDEDGTWLGEGYNGDLYEGGLSKQLTPLGQDFADYIAHNSLITEYVDLYPGELSIQPLEPAYGEPVTVNVTARVANYGNMTATYPLEVSFWDGDPADNGTLIESASTISGVPPRYEGMSLAQISWQTVATGTPEVFVEVDSGQTVVESREDNNLGSSDFSFYVDWRAVEAKSRPMVPILVGEVITVSLQAEIRNNGTAAAQGVEVQFLGDEGMLIGQTSLDNPLAPGQSAIVQVLWPVRRAGPREVQVVVDPYDCFQEPDESDNELSETILIATDQILLPLVMGNTF